MGNAPGENKQMAGLKCTGLLRDDALHSVQYSETGKREWRGVDTMSAISQKF